MSSPVQPAPPAGGAFWRQHLPMGLLAVLFLLLAAFVATQADAHGRSWDEGLQDWYGGAVYQWYATRGADLTFMTAPEYLQMPQHGPFFEAVVAAAQHAVPEADHWYVRSIVGGVTGALGVAAIALCGLELAGWWCAFLAAAGLALYPRYTGAIFNNSKDVPLAVAMIVLLWLTLRLARRWGSGRTYLLDSALVGVAAGVAVAIRVNAALWFIVLGLAAAGWWWRHGRAALADGGWRAALARQATAGVLIVGCAYLAILAFWPYIALRPVDGLIDSVRSMSAYDWTGIIPFEGREVRGDQVPRRYAPVWLLIGSPPATVLFGVVGAAFIAADLARRRLADARVLIAAALFVVPLAVIVLMRPTLYNGPRHFLFVVPGLVLLGALGVTRLVAALRWSRPTLVALVALVAVLWAPTVYAAARLHPFEYMYFSPLVGGYSGARDRYETDYWSLCQNPALDWLVDHHKAYPSATPPTVGGLFDPWLRTP
ncbi:MAG TPA: hypothetical protein VFT95_22850, partial [Micromonosporaceae bacterium]|nr:hypothetical protein [Micromonosporaceae bacterium]